MISKEIKFEPFSKEISLLYDKPIPAAKCLPEWYQKMPVHLNRETSTGLAADGVASSNLTLKGCSPFLDSLTAGYMFTLPFDIEFRKTKEGLIGVRWATNMDLVGQHGPDQAPGIPFPVDSTSSILKWKPGWRIITPTGYSTLFVHPLNRSDLPFTVLSGVVDTDTYKLGVEFPFHLHDIKDDIYILEKGTPICQAIPFRRESWTSSVIEFNEEEHKKNGFILKSKIVRSYKNQFWHKKNYS